MSSANNLYLNYHTQDPIKQTPVLQSLKITNPDLTPKDQNTKKNIKSIQKRHLLRNLKLPSSSLPKASRKSQSESRPKISELKLINNLSLDKKSKDNISLNDRSSKTPVDQIKAKNLYSKLNKKFEIIEKSSFFQSPSEYFDLFDNIISQDLLFASHLKKIKEGLKQWFDKYQGISDYCKSLEENLASKQSFINQYIISKKQSSKTLKSPELSSFKPETSSTCPSHISIPNSQWEDTQKQLNENSLKLKSLEQQLESYSEKEKKFNLFIKALQDRGYPLQDIYEKDVLNQLNSSEPNTYKYNPSEAYLSSDSSLRSSVNH